MTSSVPIVRTLLIFLCALVLAKPLGASTILFQTDSQLIALSERVVHARVVGQRTTRVGPSAHRIFTVTTLAILEDFTGREGDTVDVWELGGTLDGQTLFVGGQVRYAIGEEVLVCLDRGAAGLRSVAMGFSKFSVVRTGNAAAQLRRGIDANTSIVGGVVAAQERSLDEFRALAATVLRTPSRVAARAIPDGTATVVQPWTTLAGEPGWRWRDADQKVPVLVYRNVIAPSPLLSGDGVAEIETALAAWTNPPTASIILQYAGTALETNVEGGWSTIPEHSTLITFEDPDEIIGFPILALGGGMATEGTGGTVGGVTYFGFVNGFLVLQNAADLPPSFRQPLDFSRVVMHELGHTIGFGHTQENGPVVNPTSNIMYPSCCAPETPVPPSLGPDDLLGLNTVYPAGAATGPTMALDRLVLRMGATTSGGAIIAGTSAQTVRLTQTGAGTVSWTATATRPWIQVSPSSGTGAAQLVVSLASSPLLPASGAADGAVVFAFTGASNSPGPVSVRLTLALPGTSALPFGNIDTPIDQTAGITGAIPVTGWALDDIEVSSVVICRAAVAGETPVASAPCGGLAQFFVGSGLFIDGARPDVQATYPTYPMASRAGWGFMILTNMLPGGGNGSYQLFVYAHDREGRARLLGNRVITCDNAHATKPFGTIDTPTQGGTASGTSFVNFGWALTPTPKTIPTNGSTITVLVDGVSRGTVSYNHPRSDIASLFPGYSNSAGPVGFRILDTSTLTNGLHTISWVVTDNLGVREGVGSRFFSVSNNGAPLTEANAQAGLDLATSSASMGGGVALRSDRAALAPRDTRAPLVGRRGWDLSAPLETFESNASGTVVVRSQEINRVELRLAPGQHTGYLRRADGLAPLPVGATLDEERGIFTWAPGVGFVGAYDLTFVRWEGPQPVLRKDVRIIIGPKGSGLIGPQVVIDTPASQQDAAQPFLLAGWAIDLNALEGTGVAAVHAWAYPLTGGAPVFLGAATYGGSRPDVAGVHGEGFEDSGFGLAVQGLVPGHYDIAVFAWSTEAADFVPAKVVRITAR